MAGPAVACHLQIIEIPGNGFQVTRRRPRRLLEEENKNLVASSQSSPGMIPARTSPRSKIGDSACHQVVDAGVSPPLNLDC